MFIKTQIKSKVLHGDWQTNCRPEVSKICHQCRTEDDVNLIWKIIFLRKYLTVCHLFLDVTFSAVSSKLRIISIVYREIAVQTLTLKLIFSMCMTKLKVDFLSMPFILLSPISIRAYRKKKNQNYH